MSTAETLLLREFHHRCANDLQMIVNLLALQSRRATSQETRQALTDATERVAIIARARTSLSGRRTSTLGTALEQVCEALHSYSEPLGIVISLSVGERVDGLTDNQTTILALIVNELATNAIKHAFETKESGHIKIAVLREDAASLKIIVDDDGLPFPELDFWRAGGVGLDLVSKLTEAIGATLTLPPNGSKCFEIIVPICS